MKSRCQQSALVCGRSGFTLIEVIAVLILSGILISMSLPLIGSGLNGSRRALLRLSETHGLRTEMDAVCQIYRTTYPTNLPGLSGAIASTAADSSLSYSQVWVGFDAAGLEFIPPPGTENALRLTLSNNQGERLTAYFFPIP